MKLLITGALGQLGTEIRRLAKNYPNFEMFFTSSKELDITDALLLKNFIIEHEIEAVVNCAAYTAVDEAENNAELAYRVNEKGIQNIVHVLEETGGKLIHISTDYVFDGSSSVPYTEKDAVSPLGIYGNSKYNGEQHVLNAAINGIVIRTSWLYASVGTNFVKTMMRLGAERSELGVIFDQVGTPTYARDLAKVCLDILSQHEVLNEKGQLYHYSNEGVASWYDFAKTIMEINALNCVVKPIESKAYPTPAKRPHYSVLNKNKIKNDFDIEIPYWRDSLKDCLQQLNKEIK